MLNKKGEIMAGYENKEYQIDELTKILTAFKVWLDNRKDTVCFVSDRVLNIYIEQQSRKVETIEA
jgi:hypothetical protein